MQTERHFTDALEMYQAVVEWAAEAPPCVTILNADAPPNIGVIAYWTSNQLPGWRRGDERVEQ